MLLLAIAGALAIFAVYRLVRFPSYESVSPLAYTECPFNEPPRVIILPGIAAEDTFPVRVHEAEHARQCGELGPWRYRWRNLTGGGRLTLEAPGYCVGARARLQQGESLRLVRERLFDDAFANFQGLVDTTRVRAALRAACPDITG